MKPDIRPDTGYKKKAGTTLKRTSKNIGHGSWYNENFKVFDTKTLSGILLNVFLLNCKIPIIDKIKIIK